LGWRGPFARRLVEVFVPRVTQQLRCNAWEMAGYARGEVIHSKPRVRPAL